MLGVLGYEQTYEMTFDELVMAGKLAWRNSTRCNGRRFWRGMAVNDMRSARTEGEIFEIYGNFLLSRLSRPKDAPKLKVVADAASDLPGDVIVVATGSTFELLLDGWEAVADFN